MKILIIVLIFSILGCATPSEKASNFCDENWQGRYNSWQDCYDRKFVEKNRPNALSTVLKGMGQGLQNSSKQTSCTTNAIGNTAYTNCY